MSQHTMSPQVQAAMDASARLVAAAPPTTNPLEAARINYRQLIPLADEPQPVRSIKDHIVETEEYHIPIRIYNPAGERNLPSIIFFHGGWFIGGDLETHDRPLRALTNATGCIIIAVDYRLAPEHPFPAAINDAYAVLHWVAREGAGFGIDPSRLIIAGDSAGGAITTVVARKAAEINGIQVHLQVLLYPVTDSSLQTKSWEEFADGPGITREIAEQAWQMYVPDITERQNGDAAPIFAADLTGSPSALIIVAGYDPLRDEGIAYAARLKQAEVKIEVSVYKGMPHGFFQMAGYIDDGKKVIAEIANAIKTALKS